MFFRSMEVTVNDLALLEKYVHVKIGLNNDIFNLKKSFNRLA